MSYYGSWKIDDALTFCCNTHDVATGAATDADSAPSYRVYEDETGTAILTGSMAKLDDTNTTGFYSEQITLSAANGLEKGKCYTIYISATVGGVTATTHHNFQIEAEVDSNANSDKTGYSISGTLTTLDALDTAQDSQHAATQALIGTPTDFGSGTSTIAANLQDMADNGTATFDRATDSLQAIRDRGDAAWTTATGFSTHSAADVWAAGTRTLTAGTNIVLAKGTGVTGFNDLSAAQVNAEADTALSDFFTSKASLVDDILDEALAGHTTAGTLGKAVSDINSTVATNLDATVSSRLAAASYTTPLDAAGVRTAVGLASANLDTQLAALPTAGENADAVWEEAIADHSGTSGSTAEALNAAGAAGDPWTTALPGAYGAGSAGYIIGNNIDAAVSGTATQASVDTIDSNVDAIKAKTDSLNFGVTGKVDANVTHMNESEVLGTGASGDLWRGS